MRLYVGVTDFDWYIEACSRGPFLELFARGTRMGWTTWGDQANESYGPTWKTYAHNSLVAAE
jgi:hypothetical protein